MPGANRVWMSLIALRCCARIARFENRVGVIVAGECDFDIAIYRM
jgi:hypothetical protein